MAKGRDEEAWKILAKMARENKTELPELDEVKPSIEV